MNTLAAYQNSPTYQQERRAAIIRAVPQVAMGAADVYAASVCVFSKSPIIAGSFPVVGGIVAAGHAIYGLTQLCPPDERTRLQQVRGYGSIITGLGFAGLAAGLGPYALPLIGLGEVTRIIAGTIGGDSE